tara:strand:+ start:175 stop:291 length:117 start_codon:yes stop_codon:yes gene_type:complete
MPIHDVLYSEKYKYHKELSKKPLVEEKLSWVDGDIQKS